MCSAMKSVVILQSYLLFTLQSTAQGGKLCSLLQQFLVQAVYLHLLLIHLIRTKKEKERKKRSIVTTAFVHQHKTMSDAGLTTLLFSRRRFSSSVSS